MRRWGAAALLTVTVAACSKPVPGPATLPPLTPSSASTPSATGTASASPTETPVRPSASTSPAPTPTSYPSLRTGDPSDAAAVEAAKAAVGALYRVSLTMSLDEFKSVSYEHCNCRSTMATVLATLQLKHAHVTSALPSNIAAKVLTHDPGVVRVQLTYIVPPGKAVNDAGKVIQELGAYSITQVYQMNYIGRRWLLYFVEDPTS